MFLFFLFQISLFFLSFFSLFLSHFLAFFVALYLVFSLSLSLSLSNLSLTSLFDSNWVICVVVLTSLFIPVPSLRSLIYFTFLDGSMCAPPSPAASTHSGGKGMHGVFFVALSAFF